MRSTTRRISPTLLLLSVLISLTYSAADAQTASEIAARDDIARENWAYSVGMQAYVFGLPLGIFERERRLRLNPALLDRAALICPCAAINQVGHLKRLAKATDELPYTPNNDTVYSGALLELADDPMVLTAPDIDDRYWSVQVADAYLQNVGYIGSRATDGKGGTHLFVGPRWDGAIPNDLIVHRLPSNSAVLAIRLGVIPEDPDDLAAANVLQEKFRVTALSDWAAGNRDRIAAVPHLDERPDLSGELAYFERLAFLLAENPPQARHSPAVASFKTVGLEIGQPFDAPALDDATRRGLKRAISDSQDVMRWKVKYRGTPYPTRWNNLRAGDYGFDYFDRAAGALEGLVVHDREEAVYFSTYEDGAARFLDGESQYRVHFAADQLPPLQPRGFWSITMYGPDFQLVKNAVSRFSIGDRTPGLEYNADGSLDLYIQHEEPDNGASNWLPAPAAGLFRLNYRIYLPGERARNPATLSQYLPPVVKIN